MGRLIREIDGITYVAEFGVYGPGYSMLVADATSGNGWTYTPDEVQSTDFPPEWVAPADGGLPVGTVVKANGLLWTNEVEGNVRSPLVSGWVDSSIATPVWVQPLGAHDSYSINSIVQHNGAYWIALVDDNVWEPPINWRQTMLDANAPPPAWVQPTGAGDAYALGARVTHNAQIWVSTQAANVWEPGVFGWVVE
jgi:hypothetical protein